VLLLHHVFLSEQIKMMMMMIIKLTLCVFYHTTLTSRLKFSRNSLLVVVPWRHHLVIVLWLNSQYNRFFAM